MQKKELGDWLEVYARRGVEEKQEWSAPDGDASDVNGNAWEKAREQAMKCANPRFVLRQWLLEEVIRKVERDPSTGRNVLAKVMQVRGDVVIGNTPSYYARSIAERCPDGNTTV